MTTAATMLPLLGLRIQAGPVELRGITDDLLGPLADLAGRGIHDPETIRIYRQPGISRRQPEDRVRGEWPAAGEPSG